jgi:hypothetical protein
MSSLPVTPNTSGTPNGSGAPSQPSTADLSKLPRLPDGRFDIAHLLASLSRGDISFNEYASAFAENKRITDALDQVSQNNAKQEADAKFQKVLSVMGIGNAARDGSSQLANGNGKGYNGNGICSKSLFGVDRLCRILIGKTGWPSSPARPTASACALPSVWPNAA